MTAAGSQAGSFLPAAIAVIAAGGGLTGLAALLRSRPESGKILIDAAEGAVVVQTGVITTLEDQLRKAQEEIAALRRDMRELPELRSQVRLLEIDNGRLSAENARLSARVRQLEEASHEGD